MLHDRKDKDRDSEQLARDHIDRAADREGDINPGFGEVERDLGAGVAIADNQHALPRQTGRIAISARMHDRAGERLDAGPCRRVGVVGPAGRDDDDGRASRVLAGLDAPCPPVTPHRANRRVEDRFQGELCRVGLEIFDDSSARGIAAVSLRHLEARQAGAGSVRVQMEAVVVAPPDRADGVGSSRGSWRQPTRRNAAAVARPAGPAPMMTASHEFPISRAPRTPRPRKTAPLCPNECRPTVRSCRLRTELAPVSLFASIVRERSSVRGGGSKP